MSTGEMYFKDLTQSQISSLFIVPEIGGAIENDLDETYNPYFLYIENRNSSDAPEESKTNLYDFYDNGINNISIENNGLDITIGERITSKTQILLENNYTSISTIFSPMSGTFETIHYDSLISDLKNLETQTDVSVMREMINGWINTYVIDMQINKNPENADDSNLILTQSLKSEIKQITENVLSKIFKNLVQLIRFKRDYRMYGPGAMLIGNCYTDQDEISTYTATPPSCWNTFENNYMVGNSAYESSLPSVNTTIQNFVYNISPSTSYALAAHKHGVTVSVDKLPSGCTISEDWMKASKFSTSFDHAFLVSSGFFWDQLNTYGGNWSGEKKRCICRFKDGASININGSGGNSYSWDSNKNKSVCKLVETSNMTKNPWKNDGIVLPTYSTKVWQWSYNDTETNITNPTAFIDPNAL